MARVIFSPLISSLSGKVADAVFATWKGIPYVRERVIPENPQTAAQTAVRNSLAEAVAIWQQLGNNRQAGYEAGAQGMGISGYNDMVGRNRAHIQALTGLYGPRLNLAMTDPRIMVPSDLVYADEPQAGEQRFTWTDPGQGGAYYMGFICYDATNNVLVHDVVTYVGMDSAELTQTGFTIGNIYLWAFIVYRSTDEEHRHCQHLVHEQAS